MDGESSYESDISESWSLIDINLNEESVSVVEAHSSLQLEKSPTDSKKVELKQEENIQLEDFPNKSKDAIETFVNKLNYSDSSLKNEKFIASDKENLDEEISKRIESDEGNKNDSCDAESIEILDVDGNDRDTDTDRLDICFIHENDFDRTFSGDEESFYEENVDNESKRTCSAVIKRKRRKLSRHSNSSKDSVNSDYMSSSGKYSNKHSSEGMKSNDESRVQSCESSSRPVYKHYRNNVANTVLSLSMGVIFAGVACIAIGHFLGVHDAGETAVELMETLKKLQMENIILQSQLSHLNKAFNTRDMVSKLERSASKPHGKGLCDRKSELFSTKTEENKPNPAALPLPASEIPPSWNSIEWLSKLQNLVRTKSDRLNNANGVDINEIVMNIHDQLTYINRKQKEDARLKHLEDSDAKISKILQKIIGKLTLSQDNIENLYQKLVKLKNKLSKNLSKIIVDENFENIRNTDKKVPVTERDLLSIQWKPRKKETNHNENFFRDTVVVYKFPQPEEYYVEDRMVKLTESIGDENSTADDNLTDPPSEEISDEDASVQTSEKTEEFPVFESKENKEHGSEREFQTESVKSKHKNKIENNLKKEKIKVEKRLKRTLSKLKNSEKEPVKKNRKRDKSSILKEMRTKYNLKEKRKAFNETKYQNKKHFKMGKLAQGVFKEKVVKKKNKKSKLKKVLFSSLFANVPKASPQFKNFCYAPGDYAAKCFNLTGGWMFKWANGREQSRRHQSLGDWQFERAKGRKELRDEDFSLNWQFKRALARESNRNDDRWFYEKYRIRNHNRKGFFHEGYSWM